MPELPAHLKLFSVEQANALLPQVRLSLSAIRSSRQVIVKLEQQKAVEELSWLRPDGTVSPQAQAELDRLNQKLLKAEKEFSNQLHQLQEQGIHLKDLEAGLVDFFTQQGERLVFLCWREGEDQIQYWHDLESGFAGRQSIEQL